MRITVIEAVYLYHYLKPGQSRYPQISREVNYDHHLVLNIQHPGEVTSADT
jgi:hypothetical protein